jgi:hypothetical protein
LTDDCILVKDLIKLAKFKEEDLLIVILLYLPELQHSGSELLPRFFRNKQCTGVILGMVWSVSVLVFKVLLFEKLRQCINNFFK